MKTYLVTGSASGMGAAVAQRLSGDGHRVIGLDLRDAQVCADLSTWEGRSRAVREVLTACGGVLDGAVLAAGMGPTAGRERTILEVNLLGVTGLLDGLRPALAAADKAKVVVFGSNSTTATPLVPRAALRRLADGDTTGAARVLLRRKPIAATLAYAGSKLAVSRWCREHAVAAEWAGDGIRMNILAPGPVLTPLLRAQLAGGTGKQVRSFPVPAREYGTPEQIATWVLVMLSPAADFMVGSVITVDGGTEALLRPRAWPAPLPPAGVPRMLWSMARAAKRGQVADYSAVDSVPEPTGSTAAEGP
ncbi:SDR family oxidoreductase [Gordonia amarae]|uniref:SDR family oxidoreductase n=2 Tax=Gordonia amarae TaxID=36821 RepID=A0A857KYM6_9ACTN|nr:SDR family oxidoreductase [Gordonia amarae]MCS3879377.1 NAD(P)-dependent dehydrogenase (short-subunit alcohol dehydrogenase family) [Gordonia amarae]QHN17855.1 SDR family oxidoreductase [Gordonia amarae]QHN22386.1 SDR family oxidoreductase [Gordonia amarae]QHN31262.1 SDR family oxidoreductase [Gordonia amarae]QHN40007.1 SDR family oxidoreductase [Gordonia amarae]